MAKWRWRRCPACKIVLAAGDFIWIDGSGWGDGRARRRCPTCDHVGETADFVDVRERHVIGWIPLSPPKAAETDPQMPLL